MAGDARLLEKLRREELIPLGSRFRTRLATEFASREELLACLAHLLTGVGKRRGVPVAARRISQAALASGRASPGRRHVGRGPSLIQKDQPPAGRSGLFGRPGHARLDDVASLLFAGMHSFFFRVSPNRAKVLPMVVGPTSMARTHP